MIARVQPICNICGKPIEGVYKDESNLPQYLRTVGDTFVRWDFENHKCKNKNDNKTVSKRK